MLYIRKQYGNNEKQFIINELWYFMIWPVKSRGNVNILIQFRQFKESVGSIVVCLSWCHTVLAVMFSSKMLLTERYNIIKYRQLCPFPLDLTPQTSYIFLNVGGCGSRGREVGGSIPASPSPHAKVSWGKTLTVTINLDCLWWLYLQCMDVRGKAR